jgi:hypothetical protein
MWFLSGYIDRRVGCALVTPNCQRGGLTAWIGKLVFVCAWNRDVGRGFDVHWGKRELVRWDF